MTAPDVTAPRQDALLGILCMLTAVSLFPFLNASSKYLSATYAIVMIVWARNAGHLLFVLLAFMPTRGWRLFATNRLKLQTARSLLLLGSTGIYFTAISFIPLTEAAAISFTGPFIITALSVPFLGERVDTRRWLAVATGFMGALIIIRPGADIHHWAAWLIVASTLCSASYQLLTRKVGATDPPETTVVYSALIGTLIMTLALPFAFTWPADLLSWGLFLAMGFFGGIGHYFMAKAYRLAAASVVSPFSYAQLIGTVFIGYLVFGDLPDRWTWIGTAVIVASGLYIARRESRTRHA